MSASTASFFHIGKGDTVLVTPDDGDIALKFGQYPAQLTVFVDYAHAVEMARAILACEEMGERDSQYVNTIVDLFNALAE